MKASLLALLLTLVSAVSEGLAPPERSYKIMMLLPFSTKSHRNAFLPLAEALADRGHKIVMLVNHPPVTKHPNIEEINHELPELSLENLNMFAVQSNPGTVFDKALERMAKMIYKVPRVQDLYQKRKEFDLIIINHMLNEVVYPFAHELPFITVAPMGLEHGISAMLGNVLNPSYVVNIEDQYPLPMNMWQRFRNAVEHFDRKFKYRNFGVIPGVQREISAQFPDLPPILEIERNVSLTLLNSHFSISIVVPLLPSQVEVGPMHCRPGKPLPEDLESFISGAGPEGVVYFSIGSLVKGGSMPVSYRNMFIEAFKKLKQRVVWKYEAKIKGISDNILMRKWIPQQDVLAHPNVKVFITHGGLLSFQETIYHGIPAIVLPIGADQPRHGLQAETTGMGLWLKWEELSADLIFNSLQEIIYNPKYKANVKVIQSYLRDQPESPTDRAVFWTEYVIRHKGAPQLRCPAAQLSWVEFLMLDVLLVLQMVLYFAFVLFRWFLGAILKPLLGSKTIGKKKRE